MKTKILSLVFMAFLSTMVMAEIVDQNYPDTYHDTWAGLNSSNGRREGQSFSPDLPFLTAVEIYGLPSTHPWQTIDPGTDIWVEIWETDAGLPDVKLAETIKRTFPIDINNWKKFDLASPLDVSAYIGPEASLALLVNCDVASGGDWTIGYDSSIYGDPPVYADGTHLISYDFGVSWSMVGWDMIFRTYGEHDPLEEFRAHTPEPNSPSSVNKTEGSTLSWLMGNGAVTHKVYWGNVWADVNDRSVTPIILSQAVDGNTTPTPSTPQLGETYYWVVDEVDSGAVTVEGHIWEYSVHDFIYVDDMEDYDLSGDASTGNEIWYTWVDGFYGTSGSALTTQPNGADGTAKAMEFIYSNNGNSPYGPSGYPYYSEAVANTSALDCGSNWTLDGVAWLEVQFKGALANDPNEQLYLVIEDSTPNSAMVQYGSPDSYSNTEWPEDPNLLRSISWHSWGIDLRSFGGVNLADVQKVYIGVGTRGLANDGSRSGAAPGQYQGTLIIDEIQLRLPEYVGPIDNFPEDLYDDGTVNLKDLAVFANRYTQVERDGLWPEP